MPGGLQRIGALFIVGLLLSGCGGGKKETTSTFRTVSPPTSGPGSIAWETSVGVISRLTPPLIETPVIFLDGLSPDREVLFVTRAISANGFLKDRQLSALDSRTGIVVWSATDVQHYAVSGKVIYLAIRPSTSSGDYTVSARDLYTGDKRWERKILAINLTSFFVSGPVVAALFQTTPDAPLNSENPTTYRLLALNQGTGADQWAVERQAAPGGVGASALSENKLLLSPPYTGLDAATGTVLWTLNSGDFLTGGLLVGNNGSFSSVRVRRRLDPNTGTVAWDTPVPEAYGYNLRNTLGPDDTLFSVFTDSHISGYVEALDPNTGKLRWSAPPTSAPAPIVSDFSLNVRSIDGSVGVSGNGHAYYVERFLYTRVADSAAQFTITSLAADDGHVRWTVPLFNQSGVYNYNVSGDLILGKQTLIGPNGLVFGTRGSNIVAIRTPDTQ